MAEFFGYEIRKAESDDLAIAKAWLVILWNKLGRIDDVRSQATIDKGAAFFVEQNAANESHLVLFDTKPIAFFKRENTVVLGWPTVRLHFLGSSTERNRKIILRGIIKLVPLIEQALKRGQIRLIVFTSHSPQMAKFMARHLHYWRTGDQTSDGEVLMKYL